MIMRAYGSVGTERALLARMLGWFIFVRVRKIYKRMQLDAARSGTAIYLHAVRHTAVDDRVLLTGGSGKR